MVSSRSSQHRQQTRLNFAPLPSSSPLASDLPQYVQSKAANIRYDWTASPTKKRRLAPASASGSGRHHVLEVSVPTAHGFGEGTALPTPEPSSQIAATYEDDNAPLSPNSPVRLPSSSDEEEAPVVHGRNGRNRARSSVKKTEDTSGSLRSIPRPKNDEKTTTRVKEQQSKTTVIGISSGDESDAPIHRTVARKGQLNCEKEGRPDPTKSISVSSDDDSDPVLQTPNPRRSKQQPFSPHTPHSSK
ncbi:MAG: hypothetical protein Q9207_007274 [Kuettlingeria erythrocarpa]